MPAALRSDLLVVAGQRQAARDGATTEVLAPATGEPFARVARAGPEDVELALTAADAAFDDGRGPWPSTSATVRGRVLGRVAELLRERAEDLAELEARGAGHPIGDARWEVEAAARTFEYYAGAANKHLGATLPIMDPGLAITLREPVGVCALIVPWNFPLLIASWKVAPALACGNPIILKPASLTPLTALALGDLLVEAGVPEGAVHVLSGPGSVLGDLLVGDPRVAKVGFTGETATGAHILRQGSDTITRTSLELGGKSAALVFADADVEQAAAATPMSVFANAGQDCCARSRILVERPAYDAFVDAFARATEALVVGEPLDEATEVGPMISAGQRQTSLDYLAIGAEEGTRLVCGGEVPERPGFYLSPAVLADASNAMRVSREEIFGPVAAVIPFDDEDEAVRIANDSDYGLSGSLWTGSATRAIRVARRLRTGSLSVNSHSSVRVETPFGGMKQSGLGRELGPAAMDTYTETRTVYFAEE
jgi:acyl-CoA reductase-like NAD-dependent aldehyde dehydrogenase